MDDCYYKLIGTISHMGTAEAGHNRAYIKKKQVWYCCEDNHYPFEKLPIDCEKEQNYCLLLKKRGKMNQDTNESTKAFAEEIESNLKRPHSNESISSQETLKNDEMKICRGCGKSFVRLLGHLRQAKCKEHYDMEKLREEAQRENNIRKKKNFRERQKGTEYQEKESAGRQQRRETEMKKDPASYREKKTLEQHQRRETEMKKDPVTFREKEKLGRQERRETEMKIDPDGFREKETYGRQGRRETEMEKDPVSYREKKTKEQQARREAEMKKEPDTLRETET